MCSSTVGWVAINQTADTEPPPVRGRLTCMMLARSISLSLSARRHRSLTARACSRVRLPAPPASAMPSGRKGSR